MESREAKFLKIFGDWPLDLVDKTACGLRRMEFEQALRNYLTQQGSSLVLPKRLMAKLFALTCFFLRRRKALPRMLELVNSPDWKERAALLRRFSNVEIENLIEKVLRQSKASQSSEVRVLSAKLRRWTAYQLGTLRDVFYWLYELQSEEARKVRHLMHPPINSQFFWELRGFLKDNMRRASIEEIDVVVAGCGVVAHAFSPTEVALDVVSRIPMRISRANKRFNKQFEKSLGGTTLTYRPKRPLPIVLPSEIVFHITSVQHPPKSSSPRDKRP
jgi:hypothetical protein